MMNGNYFNRFNIYSDPKYMNFLSAYKFFSEDVKFLNYIHS